MEKELQRRKEYEARMEDKMRQMREYMRVECEKEQ